MQFNRVPGVRLLLYKDGRVALSIKSKGRTGAARRAALMRTSKAERGRLAKRALTAIRNRRT